LRLFTTQRHQRRQPGISAGWVVVLCLVMLALLTAVQVGHIHLNDAGANHCTLCQILQTAAPVGATAAAIFLVALGTRVALPEQFAVVHARSSRRFIRPPPRGY